MIRFCYTLFLYLLQPFVWLRLYYRGFKAPLYRKRWLERYGFCNKNIPVGGIIIHAVSVGETLATIPIVKALKQKYPEIPITITTMTPTGSSRVTDTFGESVFHTYLPYDLPCSIKRFIKRIQPCLFIIMETELWPNLINQLNKKDIPIIIANARLSERSARRYKKIASTFRDMLQKISCVAAQTQDDGRRFVNLGLPEDKLHITGSLKFDIDITQEHHEVIALWRNKIGAKRLVWIAASTHSGEDEIILRVHRNLLYSIPTLLLIIVPRHPERFAEVENLIHQMNFNLVKRSGSQPVTINTQVILGDTMGELRWLYGLANVAFVGGSLIPHGGQNPLEAAVHGLPILMGPSRYNFLEICEKLIDEHILYGITNEETFQNTLIQLINDRELRKMVYYRAKAFIEKNQGACEKLIGCITPYISSQPKEQTNSIDFSI